MTPAEAKKLLRRQMRKTLAAVSAESIARQSAEILSKVLLLHEYQAAKNVSVFISKEGSAEIDTTPLISAILQSNKRCFVPICSTETRMNMVRVYSMEDLNSLPLNTMGIREPISAEGRDTIKLDNDDNEEFALDLIIMPGFAFDKNGWRLGYGRGYYDRFLQRCESYNKNHGRPRTRAIAVALREQVIDGDIPRDEFDVKPDQLILSD